MGSTSERKGVEESVEAPRGCALCSPLALLIPKLSPELSAPVVLPGFREYD